MMFKTDEYWFDLCSVHFILDCLNVLLWYISYSDHRIRDTKCVRKDINDAHTL